MGKTFFFLLLGAVKLGFTFEGTSTFAIVLESDGTGIQIDEEYLPFVEQNTTFMLLQPGEKWAQYNQGTTKILNFPMVVQFGYFSDVSP